MSSSAKMSTIGKIWNLLTPSERRSAVALLCPILIGMVLETLGVSLVIPAIMLLTQSDLANKYPAVQPLFQALGNPNQETLIVGGMLVLLGVFLTKELFLALLAWWQARFAFGVMAQLSQRLFAIYLGTVGKKQAE